MVAVRRTLKELLRRQLHQQQGLRHKSGRSGCGNHHRRTPQVGLARRGRDRARQQPDRRRRATDRSHRDHRLDGPERQQGRLHRTAIGFCETVLPGRECPRRFQRPLRRAYDLPGRAGGHSSRHRDETEGELRHRIQGAVAESVVSGLSGLRFLRQPQPEARGKHGLRRRFRTASVQRSRAVRLHLLPQRPYQPDRL